MKKLLIVLSFLVIIVLFNNPIAQAIDIPISNPSFEADIVSTIGSNTSGYITGWEIPDAWGGSFRPSVSHYPGGIPDGINVAWLNGSMIYQALQETLSPNYKYTLKVYVGKRTDWDLPSYAVQIVAGNHVLAEESSLQPSSGEFVLSTITYTALPDNNFIGFPIEIRLLGGGIQVNFDDVSFNKVALETSQIPDTGQTTCYDADGNVIDPCPQEGEAFYGQDACYSINPMSYTKLGYGGVALPDTATAADGWIMTRDNVTGLIWEVKTDDGTVHDKDNTYTWYDSNPETNGEDVGTPGDGTDTEDFINDLNAENFGGYSDWRMPTIKELAFIVDLSIPNPGPTIRTAYFPNTRASNYWSSTTYGPDTTSAWLILFGYGYEGCIEKSSNWYVWAVRGGQSSTSFIDNENGTVSDIGTGLTWQQDTAPGTYIWEQALAYCENLTLGGESDWRLPTPKELKSIADYSRYNPAINLDFFPSTVSSNYWSSTTSANSIFAGWIVTSSYGNSVNFRKFGDYSNWYVRAVRGGQSGAIITENSIIFEWLPVDGAIGYELRVDNDCGFNSPEINNRYFHGVTNTSVTLENFFPDGTYCWQVRAKFEESPDGDWSDSKSFTYQLPVWAEPVWVPLYRLYKSDIHDHFYTTIPGHRDDAVTIAGYTYEKIECYISDRKFDHPDCGYLLHLYDKLENKHFYTSSETEKDAAIVSGYAYEGIVGFIYTQPVDWSVKLYRLYHAVNTDHFYTVSEFEKNHARDTYGFAEEGIVGYVAPSGSINPESRLKFNASAGYGVNTGNGNYQYTHTDLAIPGISIPFVFSRTYNSLNAGNDGPLGHGWSHSYQALIKDDGSTVIVFWPDGHMDQYDYDGSNMTEANPAKATNPGCYDTLYFSGPTGDKIYTLTKKNQSQYIFKIPEDLFNPVNPAAPFEIAQFRTIVDKNGKSISFTYDLVTGDLILIRDTAVREINLTYFTDPAEGHLGHIKQITDPIGRTITFDYDVNEDLVSVTDARLNTTQFEYDENHQLTKVTLPEFQVLENTYENFKVKTQTVDGKTYAYSFAPNLTTVTDPNTKNTQYALDTNQLTSVNDPDPMSQGVVFEFGDINNPTKPTQATDKNGNTTAFSYKDDTDDANKKVLQKGNLLTVAKDFGGDNDTTIYTYDDVNNLLTKDDPLHHTTTFTYDANKRNLTRIAYPEGGWLDFTYTGNNQLETVTDANSHVTTYSYDIHGNLTKVRDNLSHDVDFTYDGVGRQETQEDQLNRITAFDYDANNNMIKITDADNEIAEFTYDRNNNLADVKDTRNNHTLYTYNNRNLLETETDPLSLVYQFSYNDKGLLDSVIDPDTGETTYSYDAIGRVTLIKYNATSVAWFPEYDANGNLKRVANSHGETSFDYDFANRIISCNDSFGQTVSYEYDATGRLIKITYPGSKDVIYDYDNDNRLTKVTDWLGGETSYNYDFAGRLMSVTNFNGTKTIYSYDNADRLIGISNQKSDNSVISEYTFTLDDFGNHIQVTKNEPLAPALSPASITYTSNDVNQLTEIDGVSRTYDNRGNLTGTAAGNTYSYDYANRLTGATISGTPISYKYDPMGNRISRTQNATETRYILDLSSSMSRVLAETNDSGVASDYYVYGIGLISKITSTGNRYCYHYDSRGSTIAITDVNENIVNTYAYDAFGEVLAENETIDNAFKYVGQFGVMDEDNGLLFMRARYYDVAAGKFINKDPIGFDGGDLNVYAYSGGNPVMGIDPLGKNYSWTDFKFDVKAVVNTYIIPSGNKLSVLNEMEISTLKIIAAQSKEQKGSEKWHKLERSIRNNQVEMLEMTLEIFPDLAKEAVIEFLGPAAWAMDFTLELKESLPKKLMEILDNPYGALECGG